MFELGHELLAVTQDYATDVRKSGEARKQKSAAIDSWICNGRKSVGGSGFFWMAGVKVSSI